MHLPSPFTVAGIAATALGAATVGAATWISQDVFPVVGTWLAQEAIPAFGGDTAAMTVLSSLLGGAIGTIGWMVRNLFNGGWVRKEEVDNTARILEALEEANALQKRLMDRFLENK